MARSREDDALAWDGDEDPTLDVGTVPASEPAAGPTFDAASTTKSESSSAQSADEADAAPRSLPEGYTALGKGSDEVGKVNTDGSVTMPGDRQPMGNVTLVSLGVLAGVYLLYAVGWLVGANRLSLIAQLFLEPIAFQVTLWLAVLAPLIWFVTVVVLTRGGRAWIRFTLLAIGVIVLIPWPFVLAGAAL